MFRFVGRFGNVIIDIKENRSTGNAVMIMTDTETGNSIQKNGTWHELMDFAACIMGD